MINTMTKKQLRGEYCRVTVHWQRQLGEELKVGLKAEAIREGGLVAHSQTHAA